METETESTAPSAEFRPVPREGWQGLFDATTSALEGCEVEIEVSGLDIGDQIQAERLRLNGFTYDPADDTFYVYIDDLEHGFDHAIPHPREIFVRMPGGRLDQVVVRDADERQHIIRLRQPLELPSQAV